MADGGGGSVPGPSKAERESSRIAIEKWNDYLNRYVPIEQRLANRIYEMGRNPQPFEDQLAAQVNAQAADSVKDAYRTRADVNNLSARRGLTGATTQAALASGLGQSAAPIASNKRAWDAGYAYAQAGSKVSGEGLSGLSKLGSMENSANIAAARARADAANSGLMTLGELAYGAGKYYHDRQIYNERKATANQVYLGGKL